MIFEIAKRILISSALLNNAHYILAAITNRLLFFNFLQ